MKLSDWMSWKGLSDEEVSTLVGADRTVISRIRRGVSRPSWKLAGKISRVSNGLVRADDFLFLERTS